MPNLKWRPKTYMGPQGRTMAKTFDFELLENNSCRCCLFSTNKNPSWAFICNVGEEKEHKLVFTTKYFCCR